MASVVYLDTHLAVWLFYGRMELVPTGIQDMIESNDLLISPMVALELQYLHEVQRISDPAPTVVENLKTVLGVQLCPLPFDRVLWMAISQSWTRDPFDRIIVAQALARPAPLLTKDRAVRDHCPLATWTS